MTTLPEPDPAAQPDAPPDLPLARLVAASEAVAATRARNAKAERLAALLREAPTPDFARTTVAWLTGALVQGKIGIGYAAVYKALGALPPAPEAATLTVGQVGAALAGIAAEAGAGSAARRAAALDALLTAGTAAERGFLARLLTGEMRQGALDGVVLSGLALAFGAAERDVRRAVMLAGSLPTIAGVLAAEGPAGLARFQLELFRPVQPMLADTAESLDDAGDLTGWVVEVKLDGARIQVHKDGDAVKVYTRALNEVTHAVPEVVALARALPCRDAVLDGEVLAFAPGDGGGAPRPQPFQTTMRRFGRKLDVAALQAEIPLTPVVFDALRVDGEALLDRPLAERRARLAALVPAAALIPGLVAPSRAAAEAFMADTLAAGHEGLLLKRLDAPYEAGSRGASWLKLKPAKTLDLVVLAVERGSGRRSAWLSNLHLGARDAATGSFVMLGKTFKGLTDETLVWQTRELGARAVREDGHVVHVRPELVVEIAFQELEVSPRYPGGLALRFARVKGYRPDKRPDEADSIDTVRALFARQHGRGDTAQAGASPSDDESV